MKDQSIRVKLRLISAILMAAGLVAILLLFFNLDATAGMLVPPQRLAVYPAAESHDVEVTTPVSITYDQDMNPVTVNPSSFAVHARQTGWLTETLSVDGGTIMLQPTDSLHAGELVQVSATTQTLSLGDEAPLAPTVWEFTTETWGGNAVFHEHQLMTDSWSRFVALGDLDRDSDLDAITSTAWGHTRIYHNDGSGTLIEMQNFDHTSYHISDIELGDLDGDGDLDTVLINYGSLENRVLFNDGDGTFTDSGQSLWSGNNYFGKLGDLDGDGDLDLFVAAGPEFIGTIHVWKNDGTGHFSLVSDFDTAYSHFGVALADLDSDGDLDAFTTGWNNSFNKVWLNDGMGAFTEAQVIPNANATSVQLGDLDGDGDLDAYLTNTNYGYTGDLPDEVWLNDGTGHFTDNGQSLDTVDSVIPALGDLDSDGDLDVYLPGQVVQPLPDEVWANDGSGMFTLLRTVDEYYPGAGATLGDLDGDGNLDVIVFGNNGTDEGFQVYLNGDWTQANPIPNPGANSATTQCPDDPDSFYVIGGWGITGAMTQTLRYDADTGYWTRLADLPQGSSTPAAVCYQGKIYLAGGGWVSVYDSLYIYDIAADTWIPGPDMPRPASCAALGAWDGKLYLVGGTEVGSEQGYDPVDLVDMYDIATHTWYADALPRMPFAASCPGYAQAGPYLYLVGGFSGNYNFNVTATQRLDFSTGAWELGPAFTSARAMLAAAITGQHLVAIGGDLSGGDHLDATDLVEWLDLGDWPNGSWQDLGDPLPAISQGNTSACTEALLGGEIWSTGGGYIDDDGIVHFYDSNLYYPAEPCLGDTFAFALAPDSQSGSALPGEAVPYLLTITNTGELPDAYSLLVTATWPTEAPEVIGALDLGESQTLVVTVTVPLEAQPGEQDVAQITLTSQGDNSLVGSAALTTVALEPVIGFDLIPAEQSQSGDPGQIVAYTLLVTNTGNIVDTYNVTISTTWETTAPLTIGPLAPDESVILTVTVEVPGEALAGESDVATLVLTSQYAPDQFAIASLTTTAKPVNNPYLAVEIPGLKGLPGHTVTYTVQLNNLGNLTDTFTLSYTLAEWQVSLPVTTTTLVAFESTSMVVQVFIPPMAPDGATDMVTVWATSQGDPTKSDSALLTTTAEFYRLYLPLLERQEGQGN